MAQGASHDLRGAFTKTPFARQADHRIRPKPKGVEKARAKHAMDRCPLGKNQDDESIEANMLRKRQVCIATALDITNKFKVLRATRRNQELHISTSASTAQQVRHVS